MSVELFAFLLAAGAGMATVLGACVALAGKPSPRMLAGGLAFAAGAMVLVSVAEILPDAISDIGIVASFTMVLIGALCIVGMQRGLRRVLPAGGSRLARTGLLATAAIALHNLPEGMAPFLTTLASPQAGVVVAIAIALHNIPEGLAIAVPLRAAGVSRVHTIALAGFAGAAEAAGAGLAWAFASWLTPALISGLLAAVVGMMLWISFVELLPAARRAAAGPASGIGMASGAAAMAASLIVLGQTGIP